MAGIPDGPRGIDVSGHNKQIDWQAVKAGGVDFAFIKATEGTGYTSEEFASQWAGAKAAGLLRGAYHFFRWDVDALPQAAYFLAAVGDDKGELPLCVDIEGQGDGAGVMNYGQNEAVLRVRAFVEAVRRATGRTPIIYTYPSMWTHVLGDPQTFTDCPLWLASYTPNPPKTVGGWPRFTFWQYSARAVVQGVGGQVDADVFAGTLDDLHRFAGLDNGSEYCTQTGQYVGGGFLPYWKEHTYLGYPLTGEYTDTLEDGNAYTVQLFERGLLHWRAGYEVGEARIGYMYGKAAGLLK